MAARQANQPPLVVIVGPTASGKTGLAIELAQKFNGEIICADSRTVYKGMDIGTAKPTRQEQALVPHWGLDLVEPDQRFSVADFQAYAGKKIEEIRARDCVPFLVGGSGLYVDAVLFSYRFSDAPSQELRNELNTLSLDGLNGHCLENNINLPTDPLNRRRLIRAIEKNGASQQRRSKPISNSIIVGIATDRRILHQRIDTRAEQLFSDGVVKEAIDLSKRYGWGSEAMTGNIYRVARAYLEGELGLGEMKEKFTTLDRQLAKRQMTWFRRNPFIVWCELEEARRNIEQHLVNYLKA